MIGEEILYEGTSITNLRCQVAQNLNIYAPCISFLDENGKIVEDDDWYLYEIYDDWYQLEKSDNIPLFNMINNISILDQMKEWNFEEWERCVHKYLYFDYWNILKALDSYASQEIIDSVKIWSLARICSNGNMEDIKTMLAYPTIDVTKNNFGFVLLGPVKNNRVDIVSLLLDHGLNVNDDGLTALRIASKNGYLEIVTLLINHGVDVNGMYGTGLTRASSNGHLEIATILLDQGADIKGFRGTEALSRAVSNGHTQMVALLLERGVTATFESGEDIMRDAQKKGYKCIVSLLVQYGIGMIE